VELLDVGVGADVVDVTVVDVVVAVVVNGEQSKYLHSEL